MPGEIPCTPVRSRTARKAAQMETESLGYLKHLQLVVFLELKHDSPASSTANVWFMLQGISVIWNSEQRNAQKNINTKNCFLMADMVEDRDERCDGWIEASKYTAWNALEVRWPANVRPVMLCRFARQWMSCPQGSEGSLQSDLKLRNMRHVKMGFHFK